MLAGVQVVVCDGIGVAVDTAAVGVVRVRIADRAGSIRQLPRRALAVVVVVRCRAAAMLGDQVGLMEETMKAGSPGER